MAELEYGMTTIHGEDILVPTPLELEVARVLRTKRPEITEDESIFLAWDFISGSICSDHFYDIRMGRDSFGGSDPFVYNEKKCPVSISEPTFSKWIDQLIEYGEPIFCIPGDFRDKGGKLTVEIRRT